MKKWCEKRGREKREGKEGEKKRVKKGVRTKGGENKRG